MRLLITSDWHDDAVTMGLARRAELVEHVDVLVREVKRLEVDVVVFPGDAFDPGSMLHAQYELDLVVGFRRLAAASRTGTVVGIAGNHDVVEVDRPLSTLTPLANAMRDEVLIADVPRTFTINDVGVSGPAVTFLLLPYVSRAWSDAEQRGAEGGPAFNTDQAFRTAAAARRAGNRVVVVGHMTVVGAKLGSESAELSRGRDLDLPVERIKALEPALVINGHYHQPQVVRVDGLEIVIPGSPLSFTTDDPSDDKGFIVVDV